MSDQGDVQGDVLFVQTYRYVCGRCGAFGRKLWRQYQSFVNSLVLLCLECAKKDQNKPDFVLYGDNADHSGDQIGWLVPAVPDETPKGAKFKLPKSTTFWGYTSVPDAGIEWWHALPPVTILPPKMELPPKPWSPASIDEDPRVKDTVCLVEATSFERQALWEENANVRTAPRLVECHLDWKQESQGWIETVGKLDDMPVIVDVSWARLNGKLVAFWSSPSVVSDMRQVKAWLEKKFPNVPGVDAWNFHSARQYLKSSESKG